MARKRISMQKIRDIIRLKETSDLSERKIAKALNISRPVVSQYISDFSSCGLTYEQVKTIPDSQLLDLFQKRKIKRSIKYEKLIGEFPRYIQELKKTGVTLMTHTIFSVWQFASFNILSCAHIVSANPD